MCGEGESLVVGFRFFSLGFVGLGESLGDWRKAVSRMAAPRGPAVDTADISQRGWSQAPRLKHGDVTPML